MARDVRSSLDEDLRARFVAAGLCVLAEHGAAELTVRRVAEEARSSTMGIYTRFGSRGGMLEAIYRHGMETLRDTLAAAANTANATDTGNAADPGNAADTGNAATDADDSTTGRGQGDSAEEVILALAVAYRRFALANPSLYALLFERPLPDFDPSPELRTEALAMTFTILIGEVSRAGLGGGDPVRPAYLLWTAIHGMVSIELTHNQRSPLPGWFLDYPAVGEEILVVGTRAVLAGLT